MARWHQEDLGSGLAHSRRLLRKSTDRTHVAFDIDGASYSDAQSPGEFARRQFVDEGESEGETRRRTADAGSIDGDIERGSADLGGIEWVETDDDPLSVVG